jgi:hypothetical protein
MPDGVVALRRQSRPGRFAIENRKRPPAGLADFLRRRAVAGVPDDADEVPERGASEAGKGVGFNGLRAVPRGNDDGDCRRA